MLARIDKDGFTPLAHACQTRKLEVVKSLLAVGSSDEPDAKNNPDAEVPMLRGARINDWDLVYWMRKCGKLFDHTPEKDYPSVWVPSKYHDMLLMYACWYGQTQMIDDIFADYSRDKESKAFLTEKLGEFLKWQPVGILKEGEEEFRLKVINSHLLIPKAFQEGELHKQEGEEKYIGWDRKMIEEEEKEKEAKEREGKKDRRESKKGVLEVEAGRASRITEIGRAVQQECRDRSRMPSSA
eukprot:TRINITY_DN18713_c0_g1_i22.p1 TRINITY_DN18713_c0_g1~~TRINITY_DN18713_c0_g1_i22.p1  ORF type:complete len:280 (-),score=74.44 TRINITY_DN18713_c0_g1_i22:11-730(-)